MGKTLKLITLNMPAPYLQALDQLVRERFYPNRAEAIRHAVRDLLITEVWNRVENSALNTPGKTVKDSGLKHCPEG